ncbi:NUDIX domain-containing protein [Pontibacter sp. SGAir0037]|uniref:NUDIX domain-containing protein n=1 Tax=Pontibacter sp. SGAir0037 TaxID=2571030 RepID=UPI0010CCB7EC|nr:NUDIX hydrolase [Pontibacter sp. SGAir0037]QCR22961.1 GDP-mannose pyrophosphatase [Pontibacter sp. SGAir0037]
MQIKKRERAYDGFFKIDKLTVEQDGQSFVREQFIRGEAVAALVYHTGEGKYILTKQYRVGPESDLIEIVAGMVDEGEDPEKSIRREVEEEIGFAIDKLEYICSFYSSPGGITERVLLYYAEVSHQHSSGGGKDEENEQIEIITFSPKELQELVTEDAKTIIAQQWLQLKNR